jgi:hypothetical protein
MTEQFEPRAAAKGTSVSVVIGNEERELKAKKDKGGWAITPKDAAEAAALAQFSDDALDPPPPPEPGPEAADSAANGDDNAADDTGEAPTFAAANAEAGDGQEES